MALTFVIPLVCSLKIAACIGYITKGQYKLVPPKEEYLEYFHLFNLFSQIVCMTCLHFNSLYNLYIIYILNFIITIFNLVDIHLVLAFYLLFSFFSTSEFLRVVIFLLPEEHILKHASGDTGN